MSNCSSIVDFVYYKEKYNLYFKTTDAASEHYINVGKQLGYFPNLETEIFYYLTVNFDPEFYKRKYGITGDNKTVKRHWKLYDSKKGHFINQCEEIGSHPPFICKCKLKTKPFSSKSIDNDIGNDINNNVDAANKEKYADQLTDIVDNESDKDSQNIKHNKHKHRKHSKNTEHVSKRTKRDKHDKRNKRDKRDKSTSSQTNDKMIDIKNDKRHKGPATKCECFECVMKTKEELEKIQNKLIDTKKNEKPVVRSELRTSSFIDQRSMKPVNPRTNKFIDDDKSTKIIKPIDATNDIDVKKIIIKDIKKNITKQLKDKYGNDIFIDFVHEKIDVNKLNI